MLSSKASQSQVCCCLASSAEVPKCWCSESLFAAAGLAWLQQAKGNPNKLTRSYETISKSVNVLFLIMHIALLEHKVCMCLGLSGAIAIAAAVHMYSLTASSQSISMCRVCNGPTNSWQ